MKMRKEHYKEIETRITALLTDRPGVFNNYVARNIRPADRDWETR